MLTIVVLQDSVYCEPLIDLLAFISPVLAAKFQKGSNETAVNTYPHSYCNTLHVFQAFLSHYS